MASSVNLIERLASAWEISEENQSVLLRESRLHDDDAGGDRVGNSSAVSVVFSVSTFIARKSFNNFVVSPFGSHWGVVCDFERGVRYLFHLLFDPIKREVTFEPALWKLEWSQHRVTRVGTTKYGQVDVTATGEALFAQFRLRVQG